MNFVTPKKEELSPFLQLLLLLFYGVVGAMVFGLIGLLLAFAMYGTSLIGQFNLLLSGAPQYLSGLKAMQIFTSIGAFILPAIALALTERQKLATFYGFKKPTFLLLAIALLIMIASMPVMEYVAVLNQKMILPDFLKGIERWMKEKEDAAMEATINLLTVRNNIDFIVNLVMIAVLPAVGEELMFRGGVQRCINRIFKHPHAAIWLTAIIFSAIHVQFYGFIPRMLLGAGFGYLYFYSGSLWYAIAAHFINNAYAVCLAFYMQKHNLPLDKADDPIGFPWYGYLISAILTIALFKFFKDTALRERKLD
ncbi:CPBP family intramembrane glutamic endopeptidase [Pedobacter sandarakinus]|uniref:CPBP family intramembrane glutamic endopeptidase n=1 Tax=Pedobacter sandarakinus TaxID=353156 RepID=UPI002245F03F|nr:CPBP family intramembrane glutamic endopeptidase [Pedobacter sandarakinus]MCX2573740.1 CPBP family intramembrane metalloprotease [Pedobacter sandarakinus]